MRATQPYRSLVLIDPIVLTKELYYNDLEYQATSKFLIKGAKTRRDAWPSKDAALTWFNKRFPWSGWDIRVLRSFVVRFCAAAYQLWASSHIPISPLRNTGLNKHPMVFASSVTSSTRFRLILHRKVYLRRPRFSPVYATTYLSMLSGEKLLILRELNLV